MHSASDLPLYDYIAYIDEAGDPGLNRVRPIDTVGGSEWLVIGAALIRVENENLPPKWVGDILTDIGVTQRPDLHFRSLSPTRKNRVCELMAALPARYFVVTSNKKNMRQHQNTRAATNSYSLQWFYNWCCRILIERITDYVLRDSLHRHGSPRKVLFVFSRRGGHRYSQTAAYHDLLKRQARAQNTFLKKRVPKWEVLDWKLVVDFPHKDVAGLQLADCVASAFYDSVDYLDTGPCRPDAAQRLNPRMAFENIGGKNRQLDYGVCLQPTPPSKANLTAAQSQIFKFYGYQI
jgi:Protein of unknown function (DUF3800)